MGDVSDSHHKELSCIVRYAHGMVRLAFTAAARSHNPPTRKVIGCLQCTKFGWVGKHIDIIMKPTNSRTHGEPNPGQIRLKVEIGPLFSHNKYFFVGWDWFYIVI